MYLIDTIDDYGFSYVLHVLMLYEDSLYIAEVPQGHMSRENHSREKYSW